MQHESSRPILSAVFVDYDNVYLSLKRKSEEAAKRFAKDASSWIKDIATGALITPTNSLNDQFERRLVMNRCYGNPVPRRNQADNSTDMNSFAFVRHHFLRSGFEIIDCPPLTAQLKNSSDIRMVMDIRDFLDHKTNFDEFIILSSDADFTPVLHRLRSHAKRTVIFANDNTVAPYTALSDGEVREADLISQLLGSSLNAESRTPLPAQESQPSLRDMIIDQVVQAVLEADAPMPLEALADRAIRALGHEYTVGSSWAGAGSFRDLLVSDLPRTIKLTDEPPYVAYEASRAVPQQPKQRLDAPSMASSPPAPGLAELPHVSQQPTMPIEQRESAPEQPLTEPVAPAAAATIPPQPEPAAPPQSQALLAGELQQSIARIHEACKAPPFSPPEYRALFSIMAQEIAENQQQGVKTLENVIQRAKEIGLTVRQDDARYVLDAVSEADPWFENGASASLFASRFRNFVVAKCQEHGLNLSAGELDLIDAWFAGAPKAEPVPAPAQAAPAPAMAAPAAGAAPPMGDWSQINPQAAAVATPAGAHQAPAEAGEQEDFPRIVRNRLRN